MWCKGYPLNPQRTIFCGITHGGGGCPAIVVGTLRLLPSALQPPGWRARALSTFIVSCWAVPHLPNSGPLGEAPNNSGAHTVFLVLCNYLILSEIDPKCRPIIFKSKQVLHLCQPALIYSKILQGDLWCKLLICSFGLQQNQSYSVVCFDWTMRTCKRLFA